MQTEILLSYLVTERFSLGVGGRYWAMWTKDGEFACTGCDAPGVTSPPDPSKNSMERYGAFFQAAYRFDASGVVASKN